MSKTSSSQALGLRSGELISYYFPDHEAVSYFQKSFVNSNEFHLLEETTVSGFEIYLVEQWANSRKIGSVVSTFTGNESSKVSVMKLTVLTKPLKQYPVKFQEYLNEIVVNHGKLMKMESSGNDDDTNQVLFVTNLTALPSNLTLVPIPHGDAAAIRDHFVLNSNLKKLQCSGRSQSLISSRIADACEDKFRHVYRVLDDNVPIRFAIKELVNIIQISLFYFELLDARYCDGLLCDKTEEAINNWWNLVGLPHFNTKPNARSGILPPRTVAAIISLILSIRLRLQIYGSSDVPKDPFDFESFMLCIGQFQRLAKLDKTRKLDLETLTKLFNSTNAKINVSKYSYNQSMPDMLLEDSIDFSPRHKSIVSYADSGSAYSTPSKKSKNYYSKELRKLTNVVKNTVSDHLVSSRDLEDPSNSKSGARIRNRIAKFADTVSPVDVTTMELGVLTQHCLTGKLLNRLWHLSDTAPKTDARHHHHHHHHRHQHASNFDSYYQVVTLKEAISQGRFGLTAGSYPDNSLYSRGLSKVKLGLQSRRNQFSEKAPSVEHHEGGTLSSLLQPDSLIESSIERESDRTSISSRKNSLREITLPTDKFRFKLNRRNSYPFTHGEINLNVLEFYRADKRVKCNQATRFKRRNSFSLVENHINLVKSGTATVEAISDKYLHVMAQALILDRVKKDVPEEIGDQEINRQVKQMNYELIKFSNTYKQMQQRKNVMWDKNMTGDLKYSIGNMGDTIDRLLYESRIVAKRINELEEDSRSLNIKVNDQCHSKLIKLIDNLVTLSYFYQVFVDPAERNDVIVKLTGKSESEVHSQDEKMENGTFRVIVLFLYDLVLSILQLFKYDRSNMDLGRIRRSWKNLDPNRKYIDMVYSYIGHRRDIAPILQEGSDTEE